MAHPRQVASAALHPVLLAALLLAVLQSLACAQTTVTTRVQRSNQNGNIPQGADFYVLENDAMDIFCSCNTQDGADVVRLLHNGVPLSLTGGCNSMPLLHRIERVQSSTHSGLYVCQAMLTGSDDGALINVTVGNLTVFDPAALVSAPAVQFGLIATTTSLLCEGTMPDASQIWEGLSGSPDLPTGVNSDGGISSVALSHEGNYTCEVYYARWLLVIKARVEFLVVVPPRIASSPNSYLAFPDNRDVPISIGFQSRFRSNTTLVWFKDGSPIPTNRFQTTYGTEPNAETTVNFDPIRRSDNGVYRLVVANDCPAIPSDEQQAEYSFQIEVRVLPAEPHNVSVSAVMQSSAVLSWSLGAQTLDRGVDEVGVRLSFANGSLAMEERVEPGISQSRLRVIPGAAYWATVSTRNVDGIRTSNPVPFQTPAGAPADPSVTVTRIGPNTLELRLGVAYIGGGDSLSYFIQYKILGTTLWEDIATVMTTNGERQKTLNFNHPDFVDNSIAFKVLARNSRGFSSAEVQATEPLEVPGVASQPIITSSSHNTIAFSVTLSSTGKAPFLGVTARFTAPTTFDVNFSEPFQPGETVTLRVDDLEPSTEYTFSVVTENYGGIGPASPEATHMTGKAPPLPLEGVIAVAVAGVVVIILAVVIVIVVAVSLYKRNSRKREYVFGNNVTPAADPGHEIVSHHKKPLSTSTASRSSSISSPPPVPTSTSGGAGRGGVPNPQFTPNRQMSSSSGADLLNLNYLFESDSSSAAGSTVNSESDVNFPRYTYNVSPTPGETSLRSSRMTSNGTSSTRESLIYPPATPNATDV